MGCLPALKSLIASRAATQRSNHGSSAGGSRYKINGNSRLRNGSVPLVSFSNEKKSQNGRSLDASDSQEAIVKPNESRAIMVKNDVVSATSLSPY